MSSPEADLLALKSTPCSRTFHLLKKSLLADEKSHIRPQTQTILNGYRAKRYPLMALNTQRSMGPYRHILSQRVVAGTMTVHPPYNHKQTKQNPKT